MTDDDILYLTELIVLLSIAAKQCGVWVVPDREQAAVRRRRLLPPGQAGENRTDGTAQSHFIRPVAPGPGDDHRLFRHDRGRGCPPRLAHRLLPGKDEISVLRPAGIMRIRSIKNRLQRRKSVSEAYFLKIFPCTSRRDPIYFS